MFPKSLTWNEFRASESTSLHSLAAACGLLKGRWRIHCVNPPIYCNSFRKHIGTLHIPVTFVAAFGLHPHVLRPTPCSGLSNYFWQHPGDQMRTHSGGLTPFTLHDMQSSSLNLHSTITGPLGGKVVDQQSSGTEKDLSFCSLYFFPSLSCWSQFQCHLFQDNFPLFLPFAGLSTLVQLCWHYLLTWLALCSCTRLLQLFCLVAIAVPYPGH